MSSIGSTVETDTDELRNELPTPEDDSPTNETTVDYESSCVTDGDSDSEWSSGTGSYKSEDVLDHDEVAETDEDLDPFGNSDADEDGFVCETTRSLFDCLDNIQHFGSFATMISREKFVQPGLSVGAFDRVGLPLEEQDIRSLIKHCNYVQSKIPSKGRFDGQTCEITSDEISLRENWKEQVQNVVVEVVRELGVPAAPVNVRPELRHMRIHESGAVFEIKADTQKDPRSFGTLLICLPVRDQSAEFYVTHNEKRRRFKIAEPSLFTLTCLAWYSDVACTITGRLCFLQYDLRRNEMRLPASAFSLTEAHTAVSRVLKSWGERRDTPEYLCYPLKNHYPDESLKLQNLRDSDYARVRCMIDSREADLTSKFHVLLGQVQKRVRFANHKDGYENRKTEFSLCSVRDTNGFILQHAVQCKHYAVGHERLYRGRAYDFQEGGEWLGNSYADICRSYNIAVLIVVKRYSVDGLLLGPRHSASDLHDLFARLCLPRPGLNSFYDATLSLIAHRHLRKTYRTVEDTRSFHGIIAEIAIHLGDNSLLEGIVYHAGYGFPLATYRFFGVSLPEHTRRLLEKSFRSKNLYRSWIRMAEFLEGCRERARRMNTKQKEKEYLEKRKQWIKQLTYKALDYTNTATSQGAKALVKICQYFGSSVFEEKVRGVVLQVQNNEAFVNSFLIEVLRLKKSSANSKIFDDLTQLALDVSTPRFTLSYLLFPGGDATELSMENAEEAATIISRLLEALKRSEASVKDALYERFYSQATMVDRTYLNMIMRRVEETEWEDDDQPRRPIRKNGRRYIPKYRK